MAGVPKSTKTKSKWIKEPSPSIPAVRGKTSSRKGKGVTLHRSQTRTCTLSVGRSYSKVSRLGQKNLEHGRSGSLSLKRNRSTTRSRSLTRQTRHTALKSRHCPTNKSSQKSAPEDMAASVSVPKRSTSGAHSASRTSPRPNFVQHKSIQPGSPTPLKAHTSRLKIPVTKKLSRAGIVSDRTHDAKLLRPEKRVSTPSHDIRGAPASVKPGDTEVSPTRLATVTRRAPKRQDAETTKSVAADTEDALSRSYAQVSHSSARDVSLAFSVLAKPPCLMQPTVRPMIADSNAGSGAQHRNKGHDEWDNLEVWGLGRTSWRESVLANSKHHFQPDFDSRPGPRLNPEPVPQRSDRLKFSMYNAKPTNSSALRRKNAARTPG